MKPLFFFLFALFFFSLKSETFHSFSKALETPESVTELKIFKKKIDHLEQLNQFKNLENLVLIDCQIEEFPEISNLKNLKRINLSFNPLLNTPLFFHRIKKLPIESLNLNYCAIRNIPSAIIEMEYLSSLELEHNFITNISDYLAQLKQLNHLDLSHNELRNIDALSANNTAISSLEIDDNAFSDLSHSIANLNQLKNLKRLITRDLAFKSDSLQLPNSIKELELNNSVYNIRNIDQFTELEKLTINFPQGANGYHLSQLNKLKKLKKLTIDYCQGVFPSQLLISSINELSFNSNGNQIIKFHSKTRTYINKLIIKSPQLETIVNGIKQLPNLTFLNIKQTSISGSEIETILNEYPDLHLIYDQTKYSFHLILEEISNIKPVKPPFEKLNPVSEKFETLASNAREIITKSGVKFKIPSNAFLDKAGNIIQGKVQLEIRTFENPVDIFLAGIPMGIKQNGVTNALESAGMIEFRAYNSDGNEVFANPENLVKVELLSEATSSESNLYQLNDETGEWVTNGTFYSTIDNDSSTFSRYYEAYPRAIPYNPPSAPKGIYYQHKIKLSKFNKKKSEFRIMFNADFVSKKYLSAKAIQSKTDLKRTNLEVFQSFGYKYVVTDVHDKEKYKALKYYLDANKSERKKTYEFTAFYFTIDSLSDGLMMHMDGKRGKMKIPLIPDYQFKSNFRISQRKFYQGAKKFEKNSLKAQKDLEHYVLRLEVLDSIYNEALNDYHATLKTIYKNTSIDSIQPNLDLITKINLDYNKATTMEQTASFVMSGFGLWNLDRVKEIPNRSLDLIAFKDKNGRKLLPTSICLITNKRNGAYNFNNNQITYSRTAKNGLAVMFADGTLGIVSCKAFDIARKNKKDVLQLTPSILSVDKLSYKEITKLIGL